MAWQGIPDPVERIIADALEKTGIEYVRADAKMGRHLDFYLTRLNIYIEVKRFHTPRVAEQMARVPDVIVIQGEKAAVTFAKMIGGYTQRKNRFARPNYRDIVEWNERGNGADGETS
jgi:hypothetical protein